jgi:tetratricopeptide (TPR) repeat protein
MSLSRFTVPASVRGTLLVVLAVIAYVPALRAGFVWDDVQTYVVENPLIQRADGLARIWTTRQATDFYPLTFTTWWVEWHLWGAHPAGYHLVNILLHAASALLLWRVLGRLRLPGAWVAALVWTLHPVNVESVAWISQRKNTLSGLFYFAALLAWLHFDGAGARDRRRAYLGALALFLLALLAKSSVVVLPLVLLLLCWWARGRITRGDVAHIIPFAGLAVALGLVTVWFQTRLLENATILPREAGLAQRCLDAGWAVWFYLYKALLPLRLAAVYPHAAAPSALAGIASWAALVAVSLLLWWQRDRWGRSFLLAWGYFVATLLPVLGFVNIGFLQYALVADHWQYLSIVAPIALVVGLAARSFAPLRGGAASWGAAALATALVFACAVLTWRQARIYTNEETLWRDTLRKNPRAWVAYSNLGKCYLDRGQFDRAEPFLQQAMRLNRRDYVTPVNLAAARVRQGRVDEATSLLENALLLAPRYAPAHANYGALLLQQGKQAEALQHFEAAVRADPSHALAHLGMGNALVQLGRRDEAAVQFQMFTGLRPGSPNGYFNLGLLRLGQGDGQEAARCFEAAAQRGDAEARRKLNEIHAKSRPH